MVGFLRQSTASQSRMVGPFVDDTDFKTAETGLTIANTDVKLSKNGGASTNKNSGGGTHIANGMYALTFDATDTNTVGELGFSISVSGALIVVGKFVVLEEAIYDSLFAASAAGFDSNQRVNVGSWLGTAVTANDIAIRTTLAKSTHITGFNDVSASQVNSEVDAALADIGLDHLLGAAVTGTDVADDSVIAQLVSSSATADWDTYDNTTDALQAIRDRGDAAWVTGGGGSISDILNVQPLIPYGSIDLANTTDYRFGLMLINALDDLPSTAEITPGTISIDRKAIGGTSWTAVVTDAACSEIAGLIYYDEVFDSGSGYAEGDSIRITFKNQKITVAANDYEIIGATGRIFYSEIRQTMRGTDGANTTTPPTVSAIRSEMDTNSTKLAAILADTDELQIDDIPGLIAALNDLSAAEVNAEVVDAINIDTYSEPGQGTPPVGASIATKLSYLYKSWRNKMDNDGTVTNLYDFSGATVDHKQTTGESGGVVTKGDWTSGP